MLRYLLPLLLTLLTLSVSTVMADETSCTDKLVTLDALYCDLTGPLPDEAEVGSGCFDFADSVQGGLLAADLVVTNVDESTTESTWLIFCGTRESEETVILDGEGVVFGIPFTAVGAGELKDNVLTLDTGGITGVTGAAGVARCVVDYSKCPGS